MLEKLALEKFQVSVSWLQALVLHHNNKNWSVTNRGKGGVLV